MNTSSVWQGIGRALFWLCWPALYVYLQIGARTRVVVIAEGNQLLLVKGWFSDGGWHLPGGGLHRGEDPLAGAIREVREETGVVLTPAAVVSLKHEWRRSKGLKTNLHFFAAAVPQTVTPRRQAGEIVAVQWFRLNEPPALTLQTEVEQALELLANR